MKCIQIRLMKKIQKKIAHIDLADWADLILVAPATANVIGKIANGIAGI